MKLPLIHAEVRPRDNQEALFARIRQLFSEIPFNQFLGLEILSLGQGTCEIGLPMRSELIGNYVRGTAHGGVISTLIDVTGGLTAFPAMQEHAPTVSIDQGLEQFERLGTIDLRVDYLRSAKGDYLHATGHSLRSGRRIGVSRVEMTDGSGVLLAVGTGAYTIA